jgi:hypothetical protein
LGVGAVGVVGSSVASVSKEGFGSDVASVMILDDFFGGLVFEEVGWTTEGVTIKHLLDFNDPVVCPTRQLPARLLADPRPLRPDKILFSPPMRLSMVASSR